MPEKLITIAKKVNLGVASVAEYLQKNGYPDVEGNPNVRLSDEQCALIYKAFKPDMQFKEEVEEKRQKLHEKTKRDSVAIDGYGDEEKKHLPKQHLWR